MSLSQRYRNPNPEPVPFSLSTLAQAIEVEAPEVVFALLLGSAAEAQDLGGDHGAADTCTVPARSDLDIAVYLEAPPESNTATATSRVPVASPVPATAATPAALRSELDTLLALEAVCERVVPGVRADIGILNSAGVVYRYESLNGRLLVNRDPEAYAAFFSLTCRMYEEQILHFERQLRYRREAASTP
ncbi:MAG: hypothetical protein EA383_16235 [Spirochaetaceae bacterium]|nr:MAG: hypothetical protein EA383_16235 [Spirochaetaceae bacterium]